MSEDVTHFTDLDRTKDPGFFRRFLDEGNKIPTIVTSKPIILEGLRLRGGEHVLDAGCGTGADVFEVAPLVGATGHVNHPPAWLEPVAFEVCDSQGRLLVWRVAEHVPDAERAEPVDH